MKNSLCLFLLGIVLWLFMSCSQEVRIFSSVDEPSPLAKDYADIVVPFNIAPLNFHYTAAGIKKAVTTVTSGDAVVEFSGKEVVWDMQQWKSLLASAVSDTIRFSAELAMKGGDLQTFEWEVYVSPDKIDPYVSYRLIEPAYEVWHEIEIRERCLENFEERLLSPDHYW